MASPVVAGTAAFILQYFPSLTPEQLKYVIENSAVKVSGKVINPETGKTVLLSDISMTGGLLNAYEAVKLANQVATKGIVQPNKKPESNKKKAAPVKTF
jgi:subtilisin family serine protease